MSYRRALPLALAFLVAACKSPSSSPEAPAENSAAQASAPDLPDAPRDAADPREPLIAQMVAEILETQHLRDRGLDEELSREAFDFYIERIDPGKMFLLAEHVEALRSFEDRMAELVEEGDLTPAHAAEALLKERRAAVREMVESHLEKPFDFTRDEVLELDSENLAYAETEADLSDRWRRRLKLQVLENIARMESLAEALEGEDEIDDPDDLGTTLEDIPDSFEAREQKAREELLSQFQGRFERLDDNAALETARTFLNSLAATYDPHTVYMPPLDRENFNLGMSGQFEGIGAQLQEDDHYIRVEDIIPGGAAWRQGDLGAGDLILSVAQEGEEPVDVADMSVTRVVQMIRGPKGAVVILTVRKPDDSIEVISLERDVVQIESTYARGALLDLGEDHAPMGYVRLPSFYGNTRSRPGGASERRSTEDVRRLLEVFAKRGTSGVILDLRRNGGGLLEHARDITGLFIEGGPVVMTRSSTGESQVLRDRDPDIDFSGEVVVLVDRFSASASEIVAGALQDYDRAVIVGTSATHGKGTVQMMLDLDQVRRSDAGKLGAFKLTVQQFFRINGESTQSRGIVPDIHLPDATAHIESGERHLDNAIPWSSVDPLKYTRWKPDWDTEELEAQSESRQEQREVFSRIRTHSSLLKERSDRTSVPLLRSAWKAQREQDEAVLESVDPDLDEGDARFDVELVQYADAPDVEPRAGETDGSSDGRAARRESWRTELARDPWIEEALYVLADMTDAGE